MADTEPKPIHSLVLDTGSIIKNTPSVSTLLSQAQTLFTIPAVIDEIRDAVTRSRVETTLLPFLTLRQPRPGSIKIITDFARRTGDLEVLSRPDIHLMALAYELECERNHGDWRLRTTLGQKRLNGAPPESLKDGRKDECVGEEQSENIQSSTEFRSPQSATRGAWGAVIPTTADDEGAKITEVVEKLESTRIAHAETAPISNADDPHRAEAAIQHASEPDINVDEVQESEESDNEGWITPSNLKKHQAKGEDGSVEPQSESQTMQVATITTDFAMQNVLLRMNLNLLSPSLQRIKQLKTWVLRCHACFHITKDMQKQFCSRCGKPTLLRTSCSTDKDGNFKIHLKKNMQWNTRGNVYSIPKPVAGTSNGKSIAGGGKGGWDQSLILAEDQKEYVQALTGARRKEKDLMDEDYLPNILSGDRGRAGGRPKIGAGKNVNSRKRH